MNWIKNSFFNVFYLDTRSLAIFRIGMGLVILYNLYSLLFYVEAFFGPQGIYPLSLYYKIPGQISWSIHALHDHLYFIYALFALQAVLAIMLIVGYKTRLAAFLSWILAVSLVHRIYMASFGGDSMLTTFLLWGTLLPLGQSWSMDAAQSKQFPHQYDRVFSSATVGFILQLVIVYWVTGIGKDHPTWEKDFTAIYYALKTHEFAKPFGSWLTQFPDLLMVLTFLTVVIERYGLFLLFIPFRIAFFRYILIISYLIFHAMIFVTMDVGWFPLVMIVLWTALIPSSFWDRFNAKKEALKPVVHGRSQWAEALALVLMVQVFAWHYFFVQNNIYKKKLVMPKLLQSSYVLNLDSRFIFFVPSPPLITYRYHFMPVFDDPDVMPKQDVVYNAFKKQYDFDEIKHFRWRKFFFTLQGNSRFDKFIPHIKNYLTYLWNKKNPKNPKVKGAEVYFVRDKITFSGTGYETEAFGQL